jgi:hypothetical protein
MRLYKSRCDYTEEDATEARLINTERELLSIQSQGYTGENAADLANIFFDREQTVRGEGKTFQSTWRER